MDGEIYQLVAQYGSLGVLLWLVLHLFRVLIPQTLEQFRLELSRQGEQFQNGLKDLILIIQQQQRAVERLNDRIQQVLEHDDFRRAKS